MKMVPLGAIINIKGIASQVTSYVLVANFADGVFNPVEGLGYGLTSFINSQDRYLNVLSDLVIALNVA